MPYNWWTFIRVIKKEKNRDYEEWVSDNKRGLHQKHCWWVHARKSPCCCRMCWWWDLEAGWSQPGKRRFQRPPLKLKKDITAENERRIVQSELQRIEVVVGRERRRRGLYRNGNAWEQVVYNNGFWIVLRLSGLCFLYLFLNETRGVGQTVSFWFLSFRGKVSRTFQGDGWVLRSRMFLLSLPLTRTTSPNNNS